MVYDIETFYVPCIVIVYLRFETQTGKATGNYKSYIILHITEIDVLYLPDTLQRHFMISRTITAGANMMDEL